VKKTRRYISENRRKVVYYRDGGRCRYCKDSEMYEVDHIKPVSYGGNDYVFNLACSCRTCNRSRSNKYWVKPRELTTWEKVLQIILIVVFWDFPKMKDYY